MESVEEKGVIYIRINEHIKGRSRGLNIGIDNLRLSECNQEYLVLVSGYYTLIEYIYVLWVTSVSCLVCIPISIDLSM